jgi:hypothetical protein
MDSMRMPQACILLLAACVGGDDAAASGYPPPLPLEANLTSCADESECQVVELGCCDQCNGGFAVAVHSDRVAEVMARFSEDCGSSFACTEIGCAPWVVRCEQGRCGLARDSLETP